MKTAFLFTITFLVFNLSQQFYAQSFKELFRLTEVSYIDKKLDTALIYGEKTLVQAEAEFGKLDTNYCNTLNLLFDICYDKNNFKQGIKYTLLEIEIRKKITGKNNLPYATALNNLASLFHSTGNYNEALIHIKEALSIRKNILGEEHAEYAQSLNNLGGIYLSMGIYSLSESSYIEALKIRKKTNGVKDPEYASSLNNLAGLYKTIGNYSAAEPLYLSALRIRKEALGEKHPDYAASLNNLAGLYKSMNNYTAAEQLFKEATKIKKEILGEHHIGYATSLNNLAVVYQNLEKYKAAEELYLETLKIKKEILGEKHPSYLATSNNLAQLYQYIGDYITAENLFNKVLTIHKEILKERSQDFLISLNNLAVLYDIMQKPSEAEALFLKTIDILNHNVKQNFSFLSEKEKEQYFKTQSNYYLSFYAFANKRKKENPSITEKVYNSILTNKGLLLKSSTAMRTSILSSKDTSIIAKYNQWVNLNKELSKLYSTEINKQKKDPLELERLINELEKELVKGSQAFTVFEKSHTINWQSVKENLRPGETAIEFIHFNKGKKNDTTLYCALLINKKSKHPEMIELFNEKELTKILGGKSETNESYITHIYGRLNSINTQLYDLIWKPLEKSLNGTKTIYYSPSGLLHKISFAALTKSKDNYLGSNYRIELMGSTSKIALPETFDFNSLSSTCIFGDIQYDTPKTLKDTNALLNWPYLEGTKTEAEKVVSILNANNSKVVYLFGENATEAEFKSIAPNSNIVHVATHGFFFNDPDAFSYEEKQDSTINETRAFRGGNKAFGIHNFVANKNPLMRSGLAFAGANEVWVNDHNTDKEDGVLTAQEVTGMDLRKVNLMVLSACETGLGDIKGTEGVYGLQRSFKMAGVKYIIMSLWQVPDAETVEFMDKFYSKFSKNKDLKLSFYETQKEMREKYDPFYWAAFVLME